jgi:hypothetical protein
MKQFFAILVLLAVLLSVGCSTAGDVHSRSKGGVKVGAPGQISYSELPPKEPDYLHSSSGPRGSIYESRTSTVHGGNVYDPQTGRWEQVGTVHTTEIESRTTVPKRPNMDRTPRVNARGQGAIRGGVVRGPTKEAIRNTFKSNPFRP